jgi:hypothetical protein
LFVGGFRTEDRNLKNFADEQTMMSTIANPLDKMYKKKDGIKENIPKDVAYCFGSVNNFD